MRSFVSSKDELHGFNSVFKIIEKPEKTERIGIREAALIVTEELLESLRKFHP